jgi:flagellar basal body-associated protein FliL
MAHEVRATEARQGRRGSRAFVVLVVSLALCALSIVALLLWFNTAYTPERATLGREQIAPGVPTGPDPRTAIEGPARTAPPPPPQPPR